MTTSDKKLRELALAAEPDASRRDWYVVEQPWLPAGAEPYIVAGNPDPHGGLYVCDFVDAAIAGVEDNGKAAVRHCLNCDQTWSAFDEIERHAPTCVLANTDASAQSHLEYVRGLEARVLEQNAAIEAMAAQYDAAEREIDEARANARTPGCVSVCAMCGAAEATDFNGCQRHIPSYAVHCPRQSRSATSGEK